MIALIIEGAKTASEAKFWRFIAEQRFTTISDNPKGRIYYSDGADNIPNVLRQVYQDCYNDFATTGDSSHALILLDSTIDTVSYQKRIDRIGTWRATHNYDNASYLSISYASYYCFEDCLLLFDEFLDWLFSKDTRILSFGYPIGVEDLLFKAYLEYISVPRAEKKKLFCEVCESYPNLKSWVIKSSDRISFNTASFEAVAGILLEDITKNTYFRTDKTHLGKGWTSNCFELTECELQQFDVEKVYRKKTGEFKELKGESLQAVKALIEKGNRQCGLYEIGFKSRHQKANELISKSPMLANIANKCPWLYS